MTRQKWLWRRLELTWNILIRIKIDIKIRNCGVKNLVKEDRSTFAVAKRKLKNSGSSVQVWNSWPLHQTGAVFYQLSLITSHWTGCWSLSWLIINPWKDDDEVMNIWKEKCWSCAYYCQGMIFFQLVTH